MGGGGGGGGGEGFVERNDGIGDDRSPSNDELLVMGITNL